MEVAGLPDVASPSPRVSVSQGSPKNRRNSISPAASPKPPTFIETSKPGEYLEEKTD